MVLSRTSTLDKMRRLFKLWDGCGVKSLSSEPPSLAPIKKLAGFLMQRRVSGTAATRRGFSPEHGEDPPFASRFPEASGAYQAKEVRRCEGFPPVFGELERTNWARSARKVGLSA